MATYVASFPVDADPARTFGYLADFGNATAWDPGVIKAERKGDDPVGAGSRFDVLRAFYARDIELAYRVDEYVPGERVVLVADAKRTNARSVIEVAPHGAGSMVTYTTELAFGGMLKVFDRGLQVAFDSIGKRSVSGITAALSD